MVLPPEEIRKKYHKVFSDDFEKRISYYCSKCNTFFLYYENNVPDCCQFKINDNDVICGGPLQRKAFPYANNNECFEHNSITKCVECGCQTDRKILGVYVCKDCYPYVENNGVKRDFLDCFIDFNPDLIICKGCKERNLEPCSNFNDCKQHFVICDNQEVLGFEPD